MNLIESVRAVLPYRYRKLAKFLIVGGSAWVIDTGLFTILAHSVLENKVITAKIISILVSTIYSYVLTRQWSFSHRGGRERHHEAILFFLFNGIALALNLIPLWVSHYLLDFNVLHHSKGTVAIADFVSANIVGTLVGMAFRYWAYQRFVFPEVLAESPEGDDSRPPATPRPAGTR